jgi:hypothetical protein
MIQNVYADCSGFLDCLSNISTPGLKPEYSHTGFIGQLIGNILPTIFGIAGFITIIMIIISGIQFITSSGNPEAAGAARGRLVFALIGFAVIVLSFVILKLIDQVFLGNTGVV